MLNSLQIQQLAIKHQTTQLNVTREYLQNIFLNHLYQQPGSENLFFKGGTALRIVYNSPRFSEDLDFSTNKKDIKRIESLIEETLLKMEREGISGVISEATDTSGGYLAIFKFHILDQIVALRLEISAEEKDSSGEIVTIVSDFTLPYTLIRLKEEQLLSQKIQALLTRQKPMDFYDLYFILRSMMPIQNRKSVLESALKVLLQTKINFEQDLKVFLPKSHHPIIKDFKSTLQKEIQKYI